ncbi:MAG TPA: hypothetical protein VK943_14735, partial [Arenibaculum sp.]|nr:hypothetical protein [Arenibaculum sp.]
LVLSSGGSRMSLDGRPMVDAPESEYRAIYERFVGLVRNGGSDVDAAPLRHVADAFLLGRREIVEAFHDTPERASP